MNPAIYYSKVKEEEKRDLAIEDEKSKKNVNELISQKKDKPSLFLYFHGWLILMGVLTAAMGIIKEYIFGIYGPSIFLGIILLIALVLGTIMIAKKYISRRITYKPFNEEIDKKINEEQERTKNRLQKISKESEEKYHAYLTNYEQKAQEKSVDFASSELAQEIIERITDDFCQTIEAADRRPHIEIIHVPFKIAVLADKVAWNSGVYNFELNRCSNLDDMLDQTAMARAITSNVQVNVVMRYPTDVSGTNISIKIKYDYYDNGTQAEIEYVAPNGAYEERKNWED